jgi:hypothetical protein
MAHLIKIAGPSHPRGRLLMSFDEEQPSRIIHRPQGGLADVPLVKSIRITGLGRLGRLSPTLAAGRADRQLDA